MDSSYCDAILNDHYSEDLTPGLGAVIVTSDALVWQGIQGRRRLDANEPASLVDKFHIGSLTKALTATLAADLVNAGTLSWRNTTLEVWPELRGEVKPEFAGVTLQQLLQHQAGLPPYGEDEDFKSLPARWEEPAARRRTFARYVLGADDAREPGTYSNAGYGIAAAMLETVSARTWETMLRERLFKQLGLTSAGFGWPASGGAAQPWGHWQMEGKLVPHDPDGAYQLEPAIAPAGDVHLNLADYGRFMQMHLRGLRGQADLFPACLIQHLHRPAGRFALGWGRQPFMGTTISAHTGSADTFFAVAILADEFDLGVAVFANAMSDAAERRSIDLLKALLVSVSAGQLSQP